MQKVSSMFGAPPFNCKDECMGAINERIVKIKIKKIIFLK